MAANVTPDHGAGTGETSQFDDLVTTCVGAGPATTIGDGAYDTKHCHQVACWRGIRLVTPPQVKAVYGLDHVTDIILAQVNRLGNCSGVLGSKVRDEIL